MIGAERFEKFSLRFPGVAKVFQEHWQSPLQEYASTLYTSKTASIEPELKRALKDEWNLLGCSETEIDSLLVQLEGNPVLQTAHHVTPTNGPTFFAYDLISQAGLPKNHTYLVAANSGIAFSNPAWTGALSYDKIPLDELLVKDSDLYKKTLKASQNRKNDGTSDSRVSLIPARERDGLVYGSTVGLHHQNISSQFSDRLKEIVSPMEEGTPYTVWACRTCSLIQAKIINRNPILVFDINRVIARYLITILSETESHPVLDLLFSEDLSNKINRVFSFPHLFMGRYNGKKSTKVEGLVWQNGETKGQKSDTKKYDRKGLIMALTNEDLCPGVFLQFFVLRFLNGVRCLGSFFQEEYLEEFRKNWLELDESWISGLDLEREVTPALTTGRLIKEGEAVWPFDLYWADKTVGMESYLEKPMQLFWEPIVSHFT